MSVSCLTRVVIRVCVRGRASIPLRAFNSRLNAEISTSHDDARVTSAVLGDYMRAKSNPCPLPRTHSLAISSPRLVPYLRRPDQVPTAKCLQKAPSFCPAPARRCSVSVREEALDPETDGQGAVRPVHLHLLSVLPIRWYPLVFS